MEEQLIKGAWMLVGLAIGFITYYLKKTDKKVDDTAKDVTELKQDIKACYITRTELEKVETDLSNKIDKQNNLVMAKLEKIEDKISAVTADNISKKEFVTTISKIENKMDKMLDIVIEMGKK